MASLLRCDFVSTPKNPSIPTLPISVASRLNSMPVYQSPQIIPITHHQETNEFNSILSQINPFLSKIREPFGETLLSQSNVECKLHNSSITYQFQSVFPKVNLNGTSTVTFAYQTQNDMSLWSDSVLDEREQISTKFSQMACSICHQLRDQGYWADYINPSTGFPVLTDPVVSLEATNSQLFETDKRYSSCGYRRLDLGCCAALESVQWGTKVFLASLFTDAPKQKIISLVEKQVFS